MIAVCKLTIKSFLQDNKKTSSVRWKSPLSSIIWPPKTTPWLFDRVSAEKKALGEKQSPTILGLIHSNSCIPKMVEIKVY